VKLLDGGPPFQGRIPTSFILRSGSVTIAVIVPDAAAVNPQGLPHPPSARSASREGAMRKVLRHAVTEITRAGLEIEQIDQGGNHTVICVRGVRGGGAILIHRGNRVKSFFERSLRSQIRKLTEAAIDA